jgi:hypothetical protein
MRKTRLARDRHALGANLIPLPVPSETRTSTDGEDGNSSRLVDDVITLSGDRVIRSRAPPFSETTIVSHADGPEDSSGTERTWPRMPTNGRGAFAPPYPAREAEGSAGTRTEGGRALGLGEGGSTLLSVEMYLDRTRISGSFCFSPKSGPNRCCR